MLEEHEEGLHPPGRYVARSTFADREAGFAARYKISGVPVVEGFRRNWQDHWRTCLPRIKAWKLIYWYHTIAVRTHRTQPTLDLRKTRLFEERDTTERYLPFPPAANMRRTILWNQATCYSHEAGRLWVRRFW